MIKEEAENRRIVYPRLNLIYTNDPRERNGRKREEESGSS